jgi:O-methyltransferase domain
MIESTHAAPPDPAQLPEPVQLLLLVTSKWISQSIHAAAKLGIADLLADGPKTVDELARATECDAGLLHRVLRAIAAVGVFAEQSDGRIALTPLAEYLRSDVPGTMRHMAIMTGEEFMWRPYGHLVHALRTGEQPFEHVYGERVFDYMERHPQLESVFNNAMTAFTEESAEEIAADLDLTSSRVVADLGGGHGHLVASLLRANPALEGILFDRPHVVEGAGDVLRRLGVEDRIARVGGDFFREVPRGADTYVLRTCLHDWSDDESERILRNVRAALDGRPDGRLVILEAVVSTGNEWDFGKLMDIEMLVNVGGRERTEDEWRRLLERSGFELTGVEPTMPPLSIIDGRPA